jgi:hypothetical protein
MILTTGLDPVFTGGSGETGGSEETGEAATGTFAWTTLAPQAPQNADVSCKGVPQVPQNFAMIYAPALPLGFGLAWLVLSRVTHYAEVVATPQPARAGGLF